eukprot:g1852.t1
MRMTAPNIERILSNPDGRISRSFCEQSIVMGVLYALVAIVIILLAEFYHNGECRTQEYVWIIVEGSRNAWASFVCFVNAVVAFHAMKDAADGSLTDNSARAIQIMACLNCCCGANALLLFSFGWLTYGIILFGIISKDESVDIFEDCDRQRTTGAVLVGIFTFLYIVFAVIYFYRKRQYGRAEDRV